MTEPPNLDLNKCRAATALTPPAQRMHRAVLTAFAETGQAPLRADLERMARDRGIDAGRALTELIERDLVALDERGEIRAAYPFSPVPTRHRVTWDRGPIVYAMCAVGALGMSAMLGHPVTMKARNGGTLGRAKLGYLNHIDHSDGRVIRTIIVDPERAPFVQLGFELFATGDYTQEELADELYDRGLRTRATRRHPAKKISENKISQMLRDRYYLGYVEYDGEEIQGRHEPLIDEDLFDTVQEILESRMTAQERRRVHHHYLKGSLFCGRCQRDGIKRRMIIQRTINSKGAEYLYFFCRGRQKGLCQAPTSTSRSSRTRSSATTPRFASASRSSLTCATRSTPCSASRKSPHACYASRSPHSSRNSTRRRRT
jgi:hypothetical protein